MGWAVGRFLQALGLVEVDRLGDDLDNRRRGFPSWSILCDLQKGHLLTGTSSRSELMGLIAATILTL